MVESTREIEAFKKRSISVTVAPLTVEREREREARRGGVEEKCYHRHYCSRGRRIARAPRLMNLQ
jgi:hypothetical protein